MKPWQFFTALLLALACVGVGVASVLTTRSNIALQGKLQARQEVLNSGLLGERGRQLTSNILQDMARASATSEPIRKLLNKYGYNVSAPATETTPAGTTADGSGS